MTSTYEKIATNTLGSAASSVTFSSLGSYTDIVIVSVPSITSGSAGVRIRFNSDSGSNYSQTEIYGDGTSAASARNTNQTSGKLTDAISPSTNFNFNLLVNVMNYSNATTYKTFLARGNIASGGTEAVVGLWRNTAAITSLELLPTASTFATGSTFTLYGIKAE
jgi:hypothetical protein